MDMTTDTTDWTPLDTSALPPKQNRAWKAYQDAAKRLKEQREALEASLQEGLPKGKSLKVNLRFGKLSVALADASERPARTDSKAMTLAEFLEQNE